MNRKKIGVLQNTKVDYQFYLSLNEIIKKDVLVTYVDMIIVDYMDLEESMRIIISLRKAKRSVPVLWIVAPLEASRALEMLSKLEGLGRIQLEYRNFNDMQGLLQSVALLLTPDLPTKRVSMDLFIPVFNEAHRMHYVKDFAQKLHNMHEMGFPFITIYFIDDGSDDDSDAFLGDMMDAYFENSDTVDFKVAFKLLKLGHNTRKAGTYMEAFKVATSDLIIFVDADNAFKLHDISKLINIINQGYYDIVIGTKDKTAEDRPLIRDLVSTLKRILTKPLLPKGVTDSQTGLKLFRGSVVKYILPQLNESYGLAIDLKIIHVAKKLNLRILEVPVYFKDREGSHIEVVRDSIKFVKDMVKISLGM